jgi:uncharacterized protein
MYERICRNNSEPELPEWKLSSGLASLIHDVGHGPFSHTLEEVLKDNGVKFDHEEMTLRFVREEGSGIHKVLKSMDAQLPNKIAAFFDKKSRSADNWVYKIVSSQLDADRLDYVQRDSMFAGLRGHGFDFERLLDLLGHHNHSIAVERGAIEAVESYLVSVDQAYRAIYYHHAVRAATRMLISVMKRAYYLFKNDDKLVFPNLPSGRPHPITELLNLGTQVDLQTYASLSEYHLWSLIDSWRGHSDPILKELAENILCRKLLKGIEVDQGEFRKCEELKSKAKDLVRKLYPSIPDAADYFVLTDDPSRISYKGYDFKPESHDESIWLVGKGKQPTPLENDSDSHIIQAFKSKRFFSRLYMPAEIREELTKS